MGTDELGGEPRMLEMLVEFAEVKTVGMVT
jgi:hypothetical protein